MEGDVVKILASATEHNNTPVISAEISEKPQFMLDGEYSDLLIQCATEAVRSVCKAVYPLNEGTQFVLAEAIANRAIKGD